MSAAVPSGNLAPAFCPDLGQVVEVALTLAERLERGEIIYGAAEDALAALLVGPASQDVEAVRASAAGWICRAAAVLEAGG